MSFGYLHWQFVAGPVWLARFSVLVQMMLVRMFSVPILLRTLVAHWHKDAFAYERKGIEYLLKAFLWNQISRFIGFVIRIITLAIWFSAAVFAAMVAVGMLALFILWPFFIIAAVAWGGLLLIGL